MDKSNKISVRINGEDTYLDRREDSKAQRELLMAQNEHASAIEDWMEEQEKQKQEVKEDSGSVTKDLSVLERTYPVKKKRFGITKSIKRMVAAGISAVLIGMALGYVMLRLFAGMEAPAASSSTAYQDDIDNQTSTSDEGGAENSNSTETPPADQGNKEQAVTSVPTAMTFPTVQAFVVQAGVFSTKEKAEIMQNSLSTKGVQSYIWPRDNQFHLFAGVAPSKVEGEQIATLLKAQEIEVYVKEWRVMGMEKKVTQSEGEWVKTGMEQWQSILGPAVSFINTGTGDVDAITSPISSWAASKPKEITEQAAPILQGYKQYLSSAKNYDSNKSDAGLWALQASLLDLWYSYEQYLQ